MKVDLYWYTDENPDFIADVLTQEWNPKPTVRDIKLKLVGGSPKFTVMRYRKSESGFHGGSSGRKSAVNVYDMVLMDGARVAFFARVNSGLSHLLDDLTTLQPGALITVHDHTFIRLWCEKLLEWRVVMLIKDFEFRPAPLVDSVLCPEASAASSFADAKWQKSVYDFNVVDKVEKDKTIEIFNYAQTSEGWIWTFMSQEGICQGFWIMHEETRRLWKGVISRKKRRAAQIDAESKLEETCNCQDKYDLHECVLQAFPLSRCCRKDVYEQVYDWLGGNVDGSCFDELSPNHKRWALYWYYSVNVFGTTGKKGCRKKLPDCFVSYVRSYYPDPVGHCFTGYKEK